MEVIDFIDKKKNIEYLFRNITDKLSQQYTDVLYSFLGIYVIGLYAFDKDSRNEKSRKFKRKENGSRIFVGDTTQLLYSNEYIIKYIIKQKHYKDNIDLNQPEELKEFLDEYSSIGNSIPIWPRDNENRGKYSCYDLPEFYFSSSKIKPWKNILLEKYNAYLIPDIQYDKNVSLILRKE